MAEPDPFGRPTDEDPLAAMGWSNADAGVAPAGVETQARPERRPAAPRRARPSRVFTWLPKLLFFGAVLVVVAAVGLPLAGGVDDAFDSVERTVDDTRDKLPEGVSEPADEERRPASPPRGLGQRSMVLRGNLSPALKELEAELGGRLRYVRIEAERVDLQAFRRGTLTAAQARWDAAPRTFAPVPNTAAAGTYAWSQVDPSAPRRFVRTATKRARRPASAFDYAVLMDAAGLRWQVFLRDGTHFTASPDGRRVERVG